MVHEMVPLKPEFVKAERIKQQTPSVWIDRLTHAFKHAHRAVNEIEDKDQADSIHETINDIAIHLSTVIEHTNDATELPTPKKWNELTLKALNEKMAQFEKEKNDAAEPWTGW